MSEWNDTEKCEYPVGDADEAIPVWVVVADEVVEAWYINPEMNVFWFEDDDENRVEATLWMETLNVFDKPNQPTTKQEDYKMSIESLVIKHSKYADLKSDLKHKIGVELSNHKYSDSFEEIFNGKDELSNEDVIYGTCGNHAYQAVKILNRDNHPSTYTYDEVLHMYGCDNCISARELKIEMGFIGTKLGQIRGGITKAGRKLATQQEEIGND